jgi:hypothetical protein
VENQYLPALYGNRGGLRILAASQSLRLRFHADYLRNIQYQIPVLFGYFGLRLPAASQGLGQRFHADYLRNYQHYLPVLYGYCGGLRLTAEHCNNHRVLADKQYQPALCGARGGLPYSGVKND